MADNICRFIPGHDDNHTFQIIRFVQKTDFPTTCDLRLSAEYRLYYVYGGTGILHTKRESTPLSRGDLIFIMPSFLFSLESTGDLECMYISFFGERSYMLLDKLRITATNHVFHGYEEVESQWMAGIHTPSCLLDLRSEGIFLYTISVIASRLLTTEGISRKNGDIFSLVKKYLDDNFCESRLSLEDMSRDLSYSKEYISRSFKEYYQIGIKEYLNTIRIRHACTLIEQGFTNVKDIALLSGFHDPHYFSRVFKQKIGAAPREYMAQTPESLM